MVEGGRRVTEAGEKGGKGRVFGERLMERGREER